MWSLSLQQQSNAALLQSSAALRCCVLCCCSHHTHSHSLTDRHSLTQLQSQKERGPAGRAPRPAMPDRRLERADKISVTLVRIFRQLHSATLQNCHSRIIMGTGKMAGQNLKFKIPALVAVNSEATSCHFQLYPKVGEMYRF